MEHDEVINRLKGLGKGSTPPPPDFSEATTTLPLEVSGSARRFGMAPIAAAVGVIALAAASFAVPRAMSTQQVAASDSTAETETSTDTETSTETEVDSEQQAIDEKCAAIRGSAEAEAQAEVEADGEQSADALARKRADIAEWYAVNCEGQPIAAEADEDDVDDNDDADDERSDRANRPEGCTGPPPHSNAGGDSSRSAAEREAQKREWQEWHKANCTSSGGQDKDRPEPDDDADDTDDDDDADDGHRAGHQKAQGKGHGEDDSRHQQKKSEDRRQDSGHRNERSDSGRSDSGRDSDDD